MDYRHEWKHEINYQDYLCLKQRLSAVMELDPHAAAAGNYRIRSLYFDTMADKALREKIDGVNMREKFRIRYYNGNFSIIHLEKKSKVNGLCNKQSAFLTKEQAQAIVDGRIDWIPQTGDKLLIEFYFKMKTQGLRPKTIVDYTREPFIFSPGNVRVTIDYDIRTGIYCTDFLNRDCVTIQAGDPIYILEVKYDEFLPSIIRDIVQVPDRRAAAFSKYAASRIYG